MPGDDILCWWTFDCHRFNNVDEFQCLPEIFIYFHWLSHYRGAERDKVKIFLEDSEHFKGNFNGSYKIILPLSFI